MLAGWQRSGMYSIRFIALRRVSRQIYPVPFIKRAYFFMKKADLSFSGT